ncbi:DUF4330 domain-containing protein [Geitlerinema sp. PCC 7407]|uniref:DUF4330 domain-containing protein n=1 Tax=Geitlerinema sp. PCC 7407 TaxID=1173025 RepID=UPI00029F8C9D|nr:DUF4330 domain-containing protein [Geitlerinema sp. PCC 7407]AFY66155.1 hypothetical protein GEI7407_1664 [Geitlerinema sp. PCC 7407]
MAILDSKGRLFGKLSILDIAAGLVIAMVLAGILLVPGKSGTSIAQVGSSVKQVEVDVVARGLSARKPFELVKAGQPTNIIIRNQPFGEINVKSVEPLGRKVYVPQPDGSLAVKDAPEPEVPFTNDLLITLTGKAQITDQGVVLGNSDMKVGTPVRLEGFGYDFNASVIDIRVQP